MYARVTRVRIDGSPISDERIESARALMPAVSRMSGHLGAIWLIDRETGVAMSVDLYTDAQALDNTSQGDLRDEIIAMVGGELLGIEEYEVAGLDRVFERHPEP